MKTLYWIIWPAFMIAGIATAALIAVLDPRDLRLADLPVELPALGIYTIEFLAFWLAAAASSLVTSLLQRPGSDINRALSN